MGTTTLKTLGLAVALAMGSCQIAAAQSAPIVPGPYLSGEIGVESGSGAEIFSITTISRTLDSASAHAASHADYEGFLSPVPSIRAFASDFTSAAPIENYTAFAKSDFTLSYYLEVMGPGAGTVPVDVTADGRAVGNATASFDVECSGCALGATLGSPALSAWLLHTEFLATSGELYEIDLIADADPPSGDYKGTIFMASAEVDPYFRIDPSFADAAQYSLVFSPGVSDVGPGAVPELPVWMMLLMGMAGAGLMRSASFRAERTAFGLMALTVGIVVMGDGTGQRAARAQGIPSVDARLVAVNIPGASAIAEVGVFLNVPPPGACANPIPSKFPSYIQPGAVLDPKRILVGSQSNFGAPLASGGGEKGSLLSIDPAGAGGLRVPADFAQSGEQASTLRGAVQMFSANSPHWLNGVNNPGAKTAQFAGVSNPLGLSNNNAFGRVWPANAPFGGDGIGSSSILDPTGLPLAGPPNNSIGGVYAGNLTNRDVVGTPLQPQVIPGSLSSGAVGSLVAWRRVGTAFALWLRDHARRMNCA